MKYTGDYDVISEDELKGISENDWSEIVQKITNGESFDHKKYSTNHEEIYQKSGYAWNSYSKSYIIIHDIDILNKKYLVEFYSPEEYQGESCGEIWNWYRDGLKEVCFIAI